MKSSDGAELTFEYRFLHFLSPQNREAILLAESFEHFAKLAGPVGATFANGVKPVAQRHFIFPRAVWHATVLRHKLIHLGYAQPVVALCQAALLRLFPPDFVNDSPVFTPALRLTV